MKLAALIAVAIAAFVCTVGWQHARTQVRRMQ